MSIGVVLAPLRPCVILSSAHPPTSRHSVRTGLQQTPAAATERARTAHPEASLEARAPEDHDHRHDRGSRARRRRQSHPRQGPHPSGGHAAMTTLSNLPFDHAAFRSAHLIAQVENAQCFGWVSQLRLSWEEERRKEGAPRAEPTFDCYARICDASFRSARSRGKSMRCDQISQRSSQLPVTVSAHAALCALGRSSPLQLLVRVPRQHGASCHHAADRSMLHHADPVAASSDGRCTCWARRHRSLSHAPFRLA